MSNPTEPVRLIRLEIDDEQFYGFAQLTGQIGTLPALVTWNDRLFVRWPWDFIPVRDEVAVYRERWPVHVKLLAEDKS